MDKQRKRLRRAILPIAGAGRCEILPLSMPLTEDAARELLVRGARIYAEHARRTQATGRPAGGWSDLARDMGVNPGLVWMMATGKRRVNTRLVERWARSRAVFTLG